MKLFKRRKPPEKQYVMFAQDPPLPPCPVHGDKCGYVRFDDKWFPDYRPCPAWQAAIERAEFGQTHEAFWNPKTQDFDIHPR